MLSVPVVPTVTVNDDESTESIPIVEVKESSPICDGSSKKGNHGEWKIRKNKSPRIHTSQCNKRQGD